MNTSSIFARLCIRPAILALAISAGALVPSVHAQLPPPAPPVTSADAKAFDAAMELIKQEKWKDAMVALENFRNTYKTQSSKSIEAKYWLGITYFRQDMFDDAAREFRQMLTDPKIKDVETKEDLQLLVVQSMTAKGASLPSQEGVQRGVQWKAFEEAIAEADKFLATFPKSKSLDTVQFNRGTLLLVIEKYDEAVDSLAKVVAIATSPLRWQAQMNIGKARMAQAYKLLSTAPGKELKPDDAKQALNIFQSQAMPALVAAYAGSQDLAIMNEATFFAGQIRLTQHQNAPDGEDPKKQELLLNGSLDAFRAVRSREEVVVAQEAKIEAHKKQIALLVVGSREYTPYKNYYEGLIGIEEDTKKRFLKEQDQFLAARLNIARIFLLQKKSDECRVLVRYLQGQKDVLEKEKSASAEIANILGGTYVEQENVPKSIEAWDSFRKDFKGDPAGEALPLAVADLLVKKGGEANVAKAEQVLNEARADYKNWRYDAQSLQIQVGLLVANKEWEKAAKIVTETIQKATNPKPETDAEMRMNLANILRGWGMDKGLPAKGEEAILQLDIIRQKYPNLPQAEEAWFDKATVLESVQKYAPAQTELQQFIDKFKDGGGKSAQTAKNVPVAQFQLGRVITALQKPDDAIKAYRVVVDKWPESDPAPKALFNISNIEAERKNYQGVQKIMEEFLQKYPKHEYVYFAYNALAELLFTASLKAQPGKPAPQPGIDDMEAGTKKLLEYVDYEQANDLKEKKGPQTLIKISDKWWKILPKTPYVAMNAETKLIWVKVLERVVESNERLLKTYPDSHLVNDALRRIEDAQKEKLKANVMDAAQQDAYFRKLLEQAGDSAKMKARALFISAGLRQISDPVKAAATRDEAVKLAATVKDQPQPADKPRDPILTAEQWDMRLTDLFDAKKYDLMMPEIAWIRIDYPLAKDQLADPAVPSIYNAQAIALFWEAKVLQAKGDTTGAGALFQRLATEFKNSSKVLEADYGIILGLMDLKPPQIAPNALERLKKVVSSTAGTTKSFELPAKALFLAARIFEEQKEYGDALASYKSLAFAYKSVPDVASEALWRAGEILRKQAAGELPVKIQRELREDEKKKKAAAKAKADEDKAKADAEKKKEGDKPKTEGKPGDPKSSDAKPEDAKPGETKPAETKPGETKAADPAKPDGAKPEDKPTAKVDSAQK